MILLGVGGVAARHQAQVASRSFSAAAKSSMWYASRPRSRSSATPTDRPAGRDPRSPAPAGTIASARRAAQVHQRAHDDVLPRRGGEEPVIERRFFAEMLPEQMPAIDFREECAHVERVDDQVFHVAGDPPARAQEMSGEVHAFETEARAAANLEIDDGQAHRDAEAPVQRFVQETVAGIVVVLAIAAEAELFVEMRIERRDEDGRRRAGVPLQPPGRRFPSARGVGGEELLRAPDTRRRQSTAPTARGFARLIHRAKEVVGDAGQARQQGQRHGAIVARAFDYAYRASGARSSSFQLGFRLPASRFRLQRVYL